MAATTETETELARHVKAAVAVGAEGQNIRLSGGKCLICQLLCPKAFPPHLPVLALLRFGMRTPLCSLHAGDAFRTVWSLRCLLSGQMRRNTGGALHIDTDAVVVAFVQPLLARLVPDSSGRLC